MAATVEQIANQALMAAGVTRRIGDIYDGSEQAKVALELYGQTRDELLDAEDWSFSVQTAPLTLLKGPPPAGGYTPDQPWSSIYPVDGFLYEYAYPGDCLDIRSIAVPPSALPDLDPLPQRFSIRNDLTPNVSGDPPEASGPPAKVIYANATNAIATYRARVTNPAQFDTGFTASLVAALARKFVVAFDENLNIAQVDEARAVSINKSESSLKG